MKMKPLPGGTVRPHPCGHCGTPIINSRSKWCRAEPCRAQAKLAANKKLAEIARAMGCCTGCGTALPDDTSMVRCRRCLLDEVTRREQQATSRRKQTAEKNRLLELTMKRLERERQQRDRELAGVAPYASGMGNPNWEVIPDIDV